MASAQGMGTITCVLRGRVEHQDNLGNRGVIGPGDVQWMTAGSGVVHQEMPSCDADGAMYGIQLWANLPWASKMTEPRYRGIASSKIATVIDRRGASVKVVAGSVEGVTRPVQDVVTSPSISTLAFPQGKHSRTGLREAAQSSRTLSVARACSAIRKIPTATRSTPTGTSAGSANDLF